MPKKTLLVTLLIVRLSGGLAAAGLYVGKELTQLKKEGGQGIPEYPVEPQETVSETTSAEIDTSDWKTCRNGNYGFEVRYSKDWYRLDYPWAREKGLFFGGFSPDGTKNNMGVLGNIEGEWAMIEFTRGDWEGGKSIGNFFKEAPPEDQPTHYENITVDGVESMKAFGSRNVDVVVLIPRCGYSYQVDLLGTGNRNTVQYYETILNEVLSSVKIRCIE